MTSCFVRLSLPAGISQVSRDALSLVVLKAASRFSFQGLEDWSVELPDSVRVLGAEREFHDLRRKGRQSRDLRVYFARKRDGAAFARLMASAFSDLKVHSPRMLEKRDWMKRWRSSYKTQRLSAGGRTLTVVPAWKKAVGKVSVRIHPGQAFGTGTHPTTRLCLEALLERFDDLPEGAKMLDFGAGTGLLALGALALARHEKRALSAVAVESDPVALRQCGVNARANRSKLRMQRKLPAGKFDFIFANVLAPVLLRFRGELARRLKPGGRLLVSGILEKERSSFLRDFQLPEWKLRKTRKSKGWVALEFERAK